MSNKNPKHKKKITEEDLKKHLEERNKKVVEKDNIPTFKPKKKVEDQVVKKDPGTNIHRNKKGEVVIKDEEGIYKPYTPQQQPEIKQGSNIKSPFQIYRENKKAQKEVKEKVLKKADVITDVMQAGKAVPHPLFQTIGNIGSIIGSGIDAYQTYDAIKEGNYGDASINAASTILPTFLGNKTFLRNSKYSKFAPDLNNVFGNYGRTNYLNLRKQVKNQSPEQLMYNRALMGTLGVETIYDTQYSMGGNLKQQTNNNNMLNEFNEGGSHEQNPLGGIPQGMGQNGQMNTVEEGETKKDSFIYSDRIKLTPELVSQFNLPRVLANKTAAEATKIINNKFEGRNSTIDNSTKKAMLDRIAEAQETVKQVEAQKQAEIAEALNMNSTMAPEDQMNGEIPQGMEEFLPQQQMALGGFSDTLNSMGASGMLGQHTGINQLTTGVDLANTAFGKTGIDTSGATDVNPGSISVGGSALSGLTKGAQAGAMFGPWGIGIGAAIGGVAGLAGGNRAKKDAMKAHQNFQIGQSNKLVSNFAFGGNLIGEPVVGEPSKINTNIPITKEKLTTINLKPEEPLVQPTSRNKKMIGLQSGVVNDKKGEGYYYYYDKKPGDPGFNPEEHRDFVTSENHSLGQRYLLSDGKVNPQYNYQLNNYLSQNKGFKYGGNMYDNGGYLNRFKTSRIEDNPNYQAQGPEGFFKTNIPRVNSSLPKKGQFYKESFNQMSQPQVSNDLGFNSKLNYNDPDVVSLSPEQLQENNGAVTARTFGPQPNGHYEGEMYDGSKLGKALNKTGQYLKDNYGNILRYSPVAMNALQLHKLNKSGYDTVNPMINNTRYNPQYMDEKALVNQINAESNYAGNTLANSSNGSMGTLRDNILASQLAKTKGLSDAYSRVADVNRNENKTGQQFNLGIDEANIARRIAAEDKTAMNKGNWETNKSRLLSQMGTDLGNIGLEQERNNMAEAMTGYTRRGKYLYKDDGTRVSADELKSTINNTMSSVGITEKDGKYFDASGKELTSTDVLKMINSKNTTNQNRFGGYILNGPFLNNRMIKRYK